MADDELQSWFKQLSYRMRRDLAGRLQEIAEQLADDVRSAAPEGASGNLKRSVRVRRGRNTLEYFVEAGGDLTTKRANRSMSYERDVVVGSDDTQNIGRGESGGVIYDYALAVEFGTSKMAARPFFYSTVNAKMPQIREQIAQAVSDVLGKEE